MMVSLTMIVKVSHPLYPGCFHFRNYNSIDQFKMERLTWDNYLVISIFDTTLYLDINECKLSIR